MRAALLVFLLLVAPAAGCTKGPPPGGSPSLTVPTAGATTPSLGVSAALPAWNLGQGWTYAVEVPGKPTRTFKMIVAESRPDDNLWVVATNDRDQAVHHAIYSTNPMLGRIGKTTLAPLQSGAAVKMYQFPLTDGKTWTGEFFGEVMSFQAEYAGDIDASAINPERNLPARLDGFRITATGPSGVKVRYDYVEAVAWFTAFEILARDGSRVMRLGLTDLETSYRGEYFFYRGAPDSDSLVREVNHTDPVSTPTTYELNVADAFTDLVGLGLVYRGRSGSVGSLPPNATLVLRDPAGAEVWRQNLDGAQEIHVLHDVAGSAGRWTVETTIRGNVDLEIRGFGISKFAEGQL